MAAPGASCYNCSTMTKTISLRDANQRFAKIIREVEETGESYTVLRKGEPVAVIGPEPSKARKFTAEQDRAWQEMLEIMKRAKPSVGPPLTRDELYERETIGASQPKSSLAKGRSRE